MALNNTKNKKTTITTTTINSRYRRPVYTYDRKKTTNVRKNRRLAVTDG